jgi:hypothetical protein
MAARLARLASIPHLPGDTLVEFVFRRRLSLWLVLAHGDALHLPERRRTGGHQAWRRGRFAGKGGVGKSFIATVIAQYKKSKGQ